jgi:hypothetical protein
LLDSAYIPTFRAIIFAIYACGFRPRSAMRKTLAIFSLSIALAATMATPVVPATNEDLITSAKLSSDAHSVYLVFANGKSRALSVEDAGATFGLPRLRSDHRSAAWPELRRDSGSYDQAVSIAVFAGGKLHHAACDGGSPTTWRFERHDRVVLKCAFPHGPGKAWLQRLYFVTGARDGRVDLVGDDDAVPTTAPYWARVKMPK